MRVATAAEAGSYLRLIDSCITQRKAQGPSRTCNESKEQEGRGTQESCLVRVATAAEAGKGWAWR